MIQLINLKINGEEISVKEGTTVLEAAKKLNYNIPSLCYQEDLSIYGSCRICSVQIKGQPTLSIACGTEVSEGMEVITNSERVMDTRKSIFELLIANHQFDCELNCLTCSKAFSCELKKVAEAIGVESLRYKFIDQPFEIDDTSKGVYREESKCISCGRCVRVCNEVQTVSVLTMANRGPQTKVSTFYDRGLGNVDCTQCGQCIKVCPTGAIHEVYHLNQVIHELRNPKKHVVVQIAPAVRVSIGELFGEKPGMNYEGQMVTALKKIGFDKVFDTNFTADLTIMEEGSEFIKRLETGENLPLITSCSPGWINYAELRQQDLLKNISTCKSPQQMFGALSKTYYAEQEKLKRENIVSVSIMPCTAKKFESKRSEMKDDVDFVLTTRELAKLIKSYSIDFINLEITPFDAPFGISTGAAAIFGTSGGVMEAALRTAYEILTDETLDTIDFEMVRGLTGTKEATIKILDQEINVAIVSGLENAKQLLKNKEKYHFIEIMACPGGCLNGGGQPLHTDQEVLKKRMEGLYSIDEKRSIRRSHKNPAIQNIYEAFLSNPLSEKSHELLHTSYKQR